MENGFIQLRRGIIEHIESGRIYLPDFGLYTYLHLIADPEYGRLFTKVSSLAVQLSQKRDWIRDALDRLESACYIKCFAIRGRRPHYPVLIHRFSPKFGPMSGMYLNAMDTVDWRRPIFYRPDDDPITTRSRPDEEFVSIKKDLRLKIKPRAQNQRALHPPSSSNDQEQKQREKILHRDRRLEREAAVRTEAMVGSGPEVRPPSRLIDVDPQIASAVAGLARSKKI
jgi:hypothetical protein